MSGAGSEAPADGWRGRRERERGRVMFQSGAGRETRETQRTYCRVGFSLHTFEHAMHEELEGWVRLPVRGTEYRVSQCQGERAGAERARPRCVACRERFD